MMRLCVRGVAAIACVLTVGLGTVPTHASTGWQVYTHPEYGFSLHYPPGWAVIHPDMPLVVMGILGPQSAGQPDFRMNVNVVGDSLPGGVTIEDFNALADERLQRVFPDYQLLRTDRTQLAGQPAVIRYATWRTRDSIEVYQLQLGLITPGRFYVVTGTTLASSPRIKDEALLLQQILATFRP